MSSDRQQFHQSLRKWDQLQSDQDFSVPDSQGDIAILLPYDHGKHAQTEQIETFDYFRLHTLRLADKVMQASGRRPVVGLNASETDFKEAVGSPSISSIIVVGKGTFSSVEAQTGSGRITWYELAQNTDHLKTGGFWQLICGGMRKNLNVPLGTFVVSDHRNVYAPVHSYLRARANLGRAYNQLPSVTDQSRMTLPYIKETFPHANYYGKVDEFWAGLDRAERHLRAGTISAVLRKKFTNIFTD